MMKIAEQNETAKSNSKTDKIEGQADKTNDSGDYLIYSSEGFHHGLQQTSVWFTYLFSLAALSSRLNTSWKRMQLDLLLIS